MTDSGPEGGCLCGAIRYRIEGTPGGSMVCHCRTCQRVSGSAVMPWISCAKARYRVLQGHPVEFSSSPPVRRTFCGACGTPLTYWHEKEPDAIDVTTCTLDHPEAFGPSHHSWVSHSIDWVKFGDGLPTFGEIALRWVMAFHNPTQAEIDKLLRGARTIAVVGLSDSHARPSYGVARALQQYGYRIIPVNPGTRSVLGETAVPDLDAAQAALKPGERIDIVDVFRRPQYVSAIVDDVIRLRLPALWLQDGVIDTAAAERARARGVFTVMDRCLYRDRAALSVSSTHAD